MYRDALEHLVLPQYRVMYLPNGFKTAEWKRDQCRAMAAELTRDTTIDIVVAIGPWVVEDLLTTGFTRPIIGLLQHDAASQGLLDASGRPIADNLTVHVRPGKVKQDFGAIVDLYRPKRIGVLAFNDGIRDTAFFQKCWQTGKALGVDVTWAQAYGAGGTYAFFKAYNGMSKRIDVLYVSPLWGMTLPMIGQFVTNTQNDHIVLFSSEGRYLVEKGVSAAGSIRGEQSMAIFAAWKTSQIIAGAIPADLPVEYPEQRGYLVNKSSTLAVGRKIAPEIWSQADIIDEFALSTNTEVLTLAEAMSNAQTQNPSVQAVASGIDAAARRLDQARGELWPSVTLEAAATTAAPGATLNSDGSVSRERFRAGLAVEQPLFAPAVLKSIRLAREQRTATEASAEQAATDLQLAVRATYHDCLAAQQRVIELARLRDRTEEFKEIARLRAFTNPEKPDDALRWEIQRLDIVRELIDARNQLHGCVSVLHTLMGRPVLDSVLLFDSTGCTLEDFLDQFSPLRLVFTSDRFGAVALKFLESEAAKNSPGMKQQAAQVAVERAQIGLSRSKKYPSIGLRGWFGYADSLYNRPDFQEKHDIWSLSAQMSWPLFSGGSGRSGVRATEAERDRAQYQKDSTRLDVVATVQNEWRKLWTLGVQMPLAAQASARAEEYADSVRFDYLSGRRKMLEAFDALETDYEARLAQMSIRYAYFHSADALVGTIGWLSFDQSEPGGMVLMKRLQEYLRGTIAPKKSP
jgi:outer membrane protein TolC